MEMMQIHQNVNTTRKIPQERRCRKAVYSLIHRKAFPAIRINSVGYRIPKESFHAWLYQQS